jgi:hypothetical protein
MYLRPVPLCMGNSTEGLATDYTTTSMLQSRNRRKWKQSIILQKHEIKGDDPNNDPSLDSCKAVTNCKKVIEVQITSKLIYNQLKSYLRNATEYDLIDRIQRVKTAKLTTLGELDKYLFALLKDARTISEIHGKLKAGITNFEEKHRFLDEQVDELLISLTELKTGSFEEACGNYKRKRLDDSNLPSKRLTLELNNKIPFNFMEKLSID